jgi:hypothetical protein
MPSLAKTGHRFRSLLVRSDGLEFEGTIFPAEEGSVPSYDFSSPRLLLRLDHDAIPQTRDTIFDAFGRAFLMADHGETIIGNTKLYRVHRLFELTHTVPWERNVTVADPLTGLARSTSRQLLGNITCQIEMYGRERSDPQMRIKEEVRRLVTGANIQLNDFVDNMVVKRKDLVLGVWLAEIQ